MEIEAMDRGSSSVGSSIASVPRPPVCGDLSALLCFNARCSPGHSWSLTRAGRGRATASQQWQQWQLHTYLPLGTYCRGGTYL